MVKFPALHRLEGDSPAPHRGLLQGVAGPKSYHIHMPFKDTKEGTKWGQSEGVKKSKEKQLHRAEIV